MIVAVAGRAADSLGRAAAATAPVTKGGEHEGRGGGRPIGGRARPPWSALGPLLTLDLMRAVVAVVAHELRTRWRAWVGLALLVPFAGGCVLTAAAGARRTDSAYQRFLVASRASDVLVSPAGSGLGGYYGALARLP